MLLQIVAVTGATGGLGGCAVLLALAAGASKACVNPLCQTVILMQIRCQESVACLKECLQYIIFLHLEEMWCAVRAAAVTDSGLVLKDALLQVIALGRNKAAMQRLSSIDDRVVPVLFTPDEAPLQSLQTALGGKQVSGLKSLSPSLSALSDVLCQARRHQVEEIRHQDTSVNVESSHKELS